MCDGELILENSPFHHYLQTIGFTDTDVVTRTKHTVPQLQPIIVKYPRKFTDVFKIPVGFVKDVYRSCRLSCTTQHLSNHDVIKLRELIKPNLLSIHQNHIHELESKEGDTAALQEKSVIRSHIKFILPFSILSLLILIYNATIGLSNMYLNSLFLSCICAMFVFRQSWCYKYYTNARRQLQDYFESVRKYKVTCKIILSYLRDCQIAKTAFAAGVTWSKLDTIEQNSTHFEHHDIRELLFSSLNISYQLHKSVIVSSLSCAKMVSDADCRKRYLCLQEDVEIYSGTLSSHVLRYYLKLVEHMSSEVLWKLCVGTFVDSWPQKELNFSFLKDFLKSIGNTAMHYMQAESELRRCYETYNNTDVESIALSPVCQESENVPNHQADLLHQLQMLHSSLNIATLRCRETYKAIAEPLSVNEIPDISNPLALIKLNMDLAKTTLQNITDLTDTTKPGEPAIPLKGTHETHEGYEPGESIPIVPYTQQGNMVFHGVNDGQVSDTTSLDSDDEFELNLRKHKVDSRVMLAELKHVIETQPTCLYEDDYEDFKKTGLLNPTKQYLKAMYENGSDVEEDGSDEERDVMRPIGFNPFAMPMPNSLFSELSHVCETYEDVSAGSSEEEEQSEGTQYAGSAAGC